MGKQEQNLGEEMEDILGLNSQDDTRETDQTTTDQDGNTPDKETKDADQSTDKDNDADQPSDKDSDDNSKDGDTLTLTQEQVQINSEIAKIDAQIESMQNEEVNTDDFYDNIEEHLSDEEQQLEFDDKKAYLKLVREKEQEYIKEHSKEEDAAKLKEQKDQLQKIYDRQEAIVSVSKKYPEFNFDEAMDFFENKLNKEQQAEVFKGANTYADVYENTYKMMTKQNPKNIHRQKAPDIPNVNNSRREDVPAGALDDGLKSEDEELQEALGL